MAGNIVFKELLDNPVSLHLLHN